MSKVHITTSLEKEDYDYCKENNLMYSQLLNRAISDERSLKDGLLVENLTHLREKCEKQIEMNKKFWKILKEELKDNQELHDKIVGKIFK